MKEFMPSAVMQAATGSDITTAGAVKTGQKGAETAASSGFSADASDSRATFLESLENLLSAGGAEQGAAGNALSGGKPLPLAVSAAKSGPGTPGMSLPLSTDEGMEQEPALVAGLPAASLAPEQDAEMLSKAVALRDMSKLIAQTAPGQVSVNSTGAVSQQADQSIASQQNVTVLSEQPFNKPEVLLSADASIVRMQRGLSDTSNTRDSVNRNGAVKAGVVNPSSRVDVTDVQLHALKSETLLSDADQMFTSRMQMAAFNQSTELAAQKLAAENLSNLSQAHLAEASSAALSRSPMASAVLSGDSQSTSLQSMITESFGKPEWGQGMGKQILWMVNQSINRAEIRLNPANLGPLEVRVDMDNDQVNVAFTSRHADVREAVEQAMPRLREMLEEKGLNLADADISQHTFAEQHEQAFGGVDDEGKGSVSGVSFASEDGQSDDGGLTDMSNRGLASMISEGLVDYYI